MKVNQSDLRIQVLSHSKVAFGHLAVSRALVNRGGLIGFIAAEKAYVIQQFTQVNQGNTRKQVRNDSSGV